MVKFKKLNVNRRIGIKNTLNKAEIEEIQESVLDEMINETLMKLERSEENGCKWKLKQVVEINDESQMDGFSYWVRIEILAIFEKSEKKFKQK